MKQVRSNKTGFTLAEVLITLGVIGIVTAMTIPTLIQKHQKKVLALKLKTVYSTLNNALKMSIAENGDFEGWGLEEEAVSRTYVEKYWKPYLKTLKTCDKPNECNYYKSYSGSTCPVNSECWIWACYNESKTLTCINYWKPGYTTAIVLANGTYVMFETESAQTHKLYSIKTIRIDLNGSDGPNESGKDYFRFQITQNGVMPSGYVDKTYAEINANCSKDGYKSYCAAKIMHDGWQIKDDYPW